MARVLSRKMFQKLIVTTNPITEGPVTALIEVSADAKDLAITTLDGEYGTAQEFEDALEDAIQATEGGEVVGSMFNFFPMTLLGAYALYGALTEAFEATEEAES